MNRYVVLGLGLGLGLVLLAGCNREQVADLALTMAFNPSLRGTEPSVEPVAPTTDTTEAPAPSGALTGWDLLVQDLESLRQLDQAPASDPAAIDSWTSLVERFVGFEEQDGNQTFQLARQEARAVVIRAAAARYPDRFATALNGLGEHEVDATASAALNANSSAMRVLNGFLAASKLPQEAAAALSVHTLTYPDCPMNVELHRILVERLANEERLSEAVELARKGAKRCGKSADVSVLEQQVAKLVAKNPSAPGFPFQLAGRTLQNKPFDVSSLRGKIVVVTFWATWCPGCRAESVHLREFAETYRRDGVEFVGVSLDENREDLNRFLQDESISWPQLFVAPRNGERSPNPYARYYGVREIPYTIVVDREGLIAASALRGESQIETAILDQVTKSASAAK